MSKKNGNNVLAQDFSFPTPKEDESFRQLIYNKQNGTVLGRTAKSWGQLLTFYTIFYIVLAGLFAISMQGLFATLSDTEPKWKLDDSLIGTNPGLGFRPIGEETERGSVIQFDTKKPTESKYWINLINDFLKPYTKTGKKERFCRFNETRNEKDVCVVDVNTFGPCSQAEGYGYNNARPCIFLKLNKIFNWKPAVYEDVQDLPDSMPESLKTHIANLTVSKRQQVWISCDGQHAHDKENIGAIKFYPSPGIPAYYYPFLNQPGYLSPLVAVQFEKITLNQMINVECRAWARNIIYSGSLRDRMGSVAFQLYVD